MKVTARKKKLLVRGGGRPPSLSSCRWGEQQKMRSFLRFAKKSFDEKLSSEAVDGDGDSILLFAISCCTPALSGKSTDSTAMEHSIKQQSSAKNGRPVITIVGRVSFSVFRWRARVGPEFKKITRVLASLSFGPNCC